MTTKQPFPYYIIYGEKSYNIAIKESNGLRIVEVGRQNSSILVFKIPYSIIKNKQQANILLEIENRFVVYILYEINPRGKDKIYVGKSKNGINNRPQSHNDKCAKWTHCFILTTMKERTFLNDATTQYIEDKIHKLISDKDNFYDNPTNFTRNC